MITGFYIKEFVFDNTVFRTETTLQICNIIIKKEGEEKETRLVKLMRSSDIYSLIKEIGLNKVQVSRESDLVKHITHKDLENPKCLSNINLEISQNLAPITKTWETWEEYFIRDDELCKNLDIKQKNIDEIMKDIYKDYVSSIKKEN